MDTAVAGALIFYSANTQMQLQLVRS